MQQVSLTVRCPNCWERKPRTDFYVSLKGTSSCIECARIRARSGTDTKLLLAQKALRDELWRQAYLHDWQSHIVQHDGDWPLDEAWKPCLGWEGLYEISSKGRVRSLFNFKHGFAIRRVTPKLLVHHVQTFGYWSVSLVKDGKKSTQNIHGLMANAFFGKRPEGYVCGHRDGDPSHNDLSNLDWITYKENENDKRRHGRNLPGEKNHQHKLTAEQVVEMRRIHAQDRPCCKDLAFQFGISGAVANKIINRKAWKHIT